MSARADFDALADDSFAGLPAGEVVLLRLDAEDSDFVRWNHAKVRQAGHVRQAYLDVTLLRDGRQVAARLTLQGERAVDAAAVRRALSDLRAQAGLVPADPYAVAPAAGPPVVELRPSDLPAAAEIVADVQRLTGGLDFVGIQASGTQSAGFASSTGLRHWSSAGSFHLDWSLYDRADKAVKQSLAGARWDAEALAAKLEEGRRSLELVRRPARTVAKGSYRAVLAPAAVSELLHLLSWGGFSHKAVQTRSSSLLALASGERSLSPSFTLTEDVAAGVAPRFDAWGYARPDRVALVEGGRWGQGLVSARTAVEYGVEANAADGGEGPSSLDMAAGDVPRDALLERLGTGVLVHNLWYLNYSDRAGCRITGMTRFATFWVEDGRIVAPLDVMRFDDTAWRLFGSSLEGLTMEREFELDAGTYGGRSTRSWRTPWALLSELPFTL